ncbi:hypothetical protein DPMN_064738 [Dreissena polymorpha]|uniref:Rho termination factor N-terminal domain-containing protein n=1 Tax=Dreissena polymorpha TaxID=45954 RepID=A0A9D4HJQ3_DREPO|nr:hypothetical protein DPMN_064738 [Dreissena polymorpha]
MNNKTVKELKKAAKDQGMCGYSKLTKAELIATLNRRNDEDSDDDLWENARDDARAEPAKKPTMINRLFNWAVKPVKTAAKNSYDWIIKHTPEPLKKAISEKADAFKAEVKSIYHNYYKKQRSSERDIKISESAIVIKESKTALRRFARQYVIDGVEKTDAPTFLDIVKPEVVKFMSKHRQK